MKKGFLSLEGSYLEALEHRKTWALQPLTPQKPIIKVRQNSITDSALSFYPTYILSLSFFAEGLRGVLGFAGILRVLGMNMRPAKS